MKLPKTNSDGFRWIPMDSDGPVFAPQVSWSSGREIQKNPTFLVLMTVFCHVVVKLKTQNSNKFIKRFSFDRIFDEFWHVSWSSKRKTKRNSSNFLVLIEKNMTSGMFRGNLTLSAKSWFSRKPPGFIKAMKNRYVFCLFDENRRNSMKINQKQKKNEIERKTKKINKNQIYLILRKT